MTNTQLTQMALSAILRCREQIDLFDLTSVLCGRSQRDIKERGFDRIKTYGAGKAYSIRQWHYMLIQMIQQECFIIDYEEQYHLKVTEKGQRVLKGEMEVSELKVGVPAHSIFSKNNVKIQIDEDILEAVDWRKLLDDISSTAYWNYTIEKRINVNTLIPQGTPLREKVKQKFLELVKEVYNLSVDGEEIIIPLKVDYDMYGNIVTPLSLPFEECLEKLRQFIIATGRYPQMKAVAEEVALRKWYREVGHGILSVSPEQKRLFDQFTMQYPMSQYNGKNQ